MKVVAVVLNWRMPDDTIACVRSLAETAPDVTPLVVDNASGDGSVDRIRDALPGVRVVVNAVNGGYAAGNNLGIASSPEADALLVINNDAVVEPGCVDALVQALRARSDWGVAAPLSLCADDPSVVDFFTADVDLRHVALRAHGRDERRTFTLPAETDYATGSCFLVRRRVLETVGLFDERFFLVWEDVDLSLRIRRAGWGLGVTPEARVLHGRSLSFGGDGAPLHRYFFVRNSFLVLDKHLRMPWRWRARRMAATRYAGWSGEQRTPVERAIALGLTHGLTGRFGPPPAELNAPLAADA